jgi:hypothetical protein
MSRMAWPRSGKGLPEKQMHFQTCFPFGIAISVLFDEFYVILWSKIHPLRDAQKQHGRINPWQKS